MRSSLAAGRRRAVGAGFLRILGVVPRYLRHHRAIGPALRLGLSGLLAWDCGKKRRGCKC
ncbi:MAG: hypothetical protein JST28_19415 [Acidobacteria bacterium]|nr:hypothetical protein [Acidobacteriota bacterium]